MKKTNSNFDFVPTTAVHFGEGRIQETGKLVQSRKGSRVLVVSDPGIVAAGHVARARKSIAEAGIESFLFDDIEENPTTVHVDAGVRFARENDIDMIVAVGGGSSMDCAKGINFLLTNGGRMQDYWGKNKATKQMLPSIGIPTTAGTGSEAQSFALISDPETHVKMACGDVKARFREVILDPQLLRSVPQEVAALTAMDAVTHALESFVTSAGNPVSRLYAAEAWRLINGNFDEVLQSRENIEACGQLMLGANFAGTAIENAMLGAAHACANPLTAQFGVTHGMAVGLMMPHILRFNREVCEEDYRQLAGIAGLETGAGAVDQLIARVENMLDICEFPHRLSQLPISREALQKLAQAAGEQWTGNFNPRAFNTEVALQLYQCAY